jgi:uncharacterized phage protein gp47/JayE
MTHIEDNRNIRTASKKWNSGITFSKNSNTYKLLKSLLTQADRIDDDVEDIRDSYHIDTATGKNLEKFGNLADVDRKENESDEAYRARIKATFRAATTSGTFDEFVQFSSSVLSTNVNNLTFTTKLPESATVRVGADGKIYDNVDLTNQQVVELLNRGIPAGHEVNIVERGTFIVKSDGQADVAENGLTSDTIDTGGTLAADII